MSSFKIDFGYRARNSRVKYLVPVIEGWVAATKRDAKNVPDEPSYWYGERANVSMFAAGAWLGGAVALQEFAGSKGRGEDKYDGRHDLHIKHKKRSIYIEAKLNYLRAGFNSDTRKKRVCGYIKASVEDAKNLHIPKVEMVGCAFIVPTFRKDDFPDFENSATGIIRQEIESVVDLDCADMWAWCFPAETRGCRWKEKLVSYYPGVILGIRDSKRH
jgi:hypothetical protein